MYLLGFRLLRALFLVLQSARLTGGGKDRTFDASRTAMQRPKRGETITLLLI